MKTGHITKEQVFKSPFVHKLGSFLTDSLITLRKRNGIGKLFVRLTEGTECATDGEEIVIGCGFPFFSHESLKSVSEVITLMLGLLFHEMGHVLYTPFSALKMGKAYLMNGKMWPEGPEKSKALYEYIARGRKEAARAYTYYVKIMNILEDGRCEYLMLTCQAEYARFAAGLRLKRKIQKSILPPAEELLDRIERAQGDEKAYQKQDFIICGIFQLALYGVIKDEKAEHYERAEMKKLSEIAPLISEATDSVTAEELFRALNGIYCAIFAEYLLPYLETIKDEDEEICENAGGTATSSAVEKALSDALSGLGTADVRDESAKNHSLERKTEAAKEKERKRKAKHTGENETDEKGENPCEIVREETDSIWAEAEDAGKVTFTEEDERAARSIDLGAIEKITLEKADDDFDHELKAPENLDYGHAHDGVSWKVNMCPDFAGKSAELLYEGFARYVEAGKIAARKVKPFLNPARKQIYEKGRYSGTRFDAARLANPDLRYFSKKTVFPKSPTLSVLILVDESGSMMNGKIEVARATAIAIYEMCRDLDVNYAVFGHKAHSYQVELNCYCYFGEKKDSAKYRLMKMDAAGANRDGAALRYCSELLKKQESDRKLLLVISDGQPSAFGYSGTAAEADIRAVLKDYERFGIKYIAAAIDADKERIREIYGNERFLDITALELLPAEIAAIIRRMLV